MITTTIMPANMPVNMPVMDGVVKHMRDKISPRHLLGVYRGIGQEEPYGDFARIS